MLYIIGLGLEINGISLHGKKILKSAAVKKVYLEEYTVDFPYTKKESLFLTPHKSAGFLFLA